MVFRLAFCPCLAEAVTVAVASHLILGFPWLWGFMLGFVLAAVSPAVVVPCLLQLQQEGWVLGTRFLYGIFLCMSACFVDTALPRASPP